MEEALEQEKALLEQVRRLERGMPGPAPEAEQNMEREMPEGIPRPALRAPERRTSEGGGTGPAERTGRTPAEEIPEQTSQNQRQIQPPSTKHTARPDTALSAGEGPEAIRQVEGSVKARAGAPASPLLSGLADIPALPLPSRPADAPASPLSPGAADAPASPLLSGSVDAPVSPLPSGAADAPASPLLSGSVDAPVSPLPSGTADAPAPPLPSGTADAPALPLPSGTADAPAPPLPSGGADAPVSSLPSGAPDALLVQLERLDRASAASAAGARHGAAEVPPPGERRSYPVSLSGSRAAGFSGAAGAEKRDGTFGAGWRRSGAASTGALDWAEQADRVFRRDSRRYDGSFYLY